MIQRQQENDLYTMTTLQEDAGSVTSTMSTTNNSTYSSSASSSSTKSSSSQYIPSTTIITKPAQFDILCGKDKTYNKHAGNQVFRAMIETWVQTYQQANTKQEKMRITKQIVHSLQVQFESRFLKPATTDARSSGEWKEISNQMARDKVSHALRFAAKQQTLVKTAMQAQVAGKKQQQQPKRSVTYRHTSHPARSVTKITTPAIVEKKAPVVAIEEKHANASKSVESLFQLQQAILLGSLNANSSSSRIRQQQQQEEDACDDEQEAEPEFNTLRSEDLNAILNEPLELEDDYDTFMSLTR